MNARNNRINNIKLTKSFQALATPNYIEDTNEVVCDPNFHHQDFERYSNQNL